MISGESQTFLQAEYLSMLALIKDWCPPVIFRLLKRLVYSSSANKSLSAEFIHQGRYQKWEDALHDSDGYDSQIILDKTLAATLQVKTGRALFERDSVVFHNAEYPFFLIACLLYISLKKDSELSVLDFGGALGTSFFQCRKFLSPLSKLRWSVIEQPGHVDVGKRHFEDDQLKFYPTIKDCLVYEKPDVVLLSGVLQFVEKPYEIIDLVNESHIDYVVVDRQTLSPNEMEWICIKNVPPDIYPASYPMWVLSERRFLDAWSTSYDVMAISEDTDKLVLNQYENLSRKKVFYSRKK